MNRIRNDSARRTVTTALACAAITVLSTASSASAQVTDARSVAAAVQSFYNQTRGVQAQFEQSYFYRLYNRRDRSRGSVTFLKPGMMRWRYARPNGKVITSHGNNLWIFEPGSEGERGQCITQTVGDNQLPQAFSFLTGEGQLDENFSFRLLDAERHGYSNGYVLELRPAEESPHYDRILFFVPEREGRPSGIVRRVLIIDASGNRNRFDFSNLEWNPQVAESNFRFRPPRGVRCIQP